MSADALPIDVEFYRSRLTYDAVSGVLTWKKQHDLVATGAAEIRRWNSRYAGKPAGSVCGGYLRVNCGIGKVSAHRICWAIAHGHEPVGHIDHIDGNRTNNALSNLRDVSPLENNRNTSRSRSLPIGVYENKKSGKPWCSMIRVDGALKWLGAFDTFEAAVSARKSADVLYGFHENHGGR